MRGPGVVWSRLTVAALALALTGCLVGPDYKRPESGSPAQFRFGPGAPLDQASVARRPSPLRSRETGNRSTAMPLTRSTPGANSLRHVR